MIESRYWRQVLRDELVWLRSRRRYKRWSEKQQVLFERRLILVAFQIRVLLERFKVSDRARGLHLDGCLYKKIGPRPFTMLDTASLEEHFDIANPVPVRLGILELCNQLIHHYVLFASGGRGQFEAIAVFSDYKRHVCMYEFQAERVIDLFEIFASEDSAPYDNLYALEWDERKRDYVRRLQPLPNIPEPW